MDLFDAIYLRKSVRKYKPTALSATDLNRVDSIISNIEYLYKNINIKIYLLENGTLLQNPNSRFFGSYTLVKAPHYLIVTSEIKDGYLENVGFALEHIVLSLTREGFGTCWIGGMVNKIITNKIVRIKKNHVPAVIIALGYPEEPLDCAANPVGTKKRLDIKDFVFGTMDKSLLQIMDAVRMAPSSMNSQPWRFWIENNNIDLYINIKGFLGIKPLKKLNRIDAGIALCHFFIASSHFDMPFEIKPIPGKERDGLSYITSIIQK